MGQMRAANKFGEKILHELATPLIYLYISLCFIIYIETSRLWVVCFALRCVVFIYLTSVLHACAASSSFY